MSITPASNRPLSTLRVKVHPDFIKKLDQVLESDPAFATHSDLVRAFLRGGYAAYLQQKAVLNQ